jgi:hypothetical protein
MGLFGPKPFPTTSYGYTPPSAATAHGWVCANWDCRASVHKNDVGVSSREIAKKWPLACAQCGSTADPLFDEPWKHEAEGLELQWILRTRPGETGGFYEGRWMEWQLKDAYLRSDRAAASRLHGEILARIRANQQSNPESQPGSSLFIPIGEAIAAADLDNAADYFAFWFAVSQTDDVENHNGNRTNSRQVVDLASRFLGAPGGGTHPRAAEVRRGCLRIAEGAYQVLLPHQQAAVQQMARG